MLRIQKANLHFKAGNFEIWLTLKLNFSTTIRILKDEVNFTFFWPTIKAIKRALLHLVWPFTYLEKPFPKDKERVDENLCQFVVSFLSFLCTWKREKITFFVRPKLELFLDFLASKLSSNLVQKFSWN